MQEQPVAPEDEVVLVPEAIAGLGARGLSGRLVDGVVVGLGSAAHQLERVPVVAALVAVHRDPGVLGQRLGRDLAPHPLGHREPVLVEETS